MGSKSKSSNKGGGNRGKVLQQDYSSFKTPEATQAALNSQKKILDKYKTSTGAFANQADALKKAGYTLNNTMDKVMSPTGGTIAGINKNNQLFSGNQEVSDILKKDLFKNSRPTKPSPSFSPESTRQDDRVANTFNVLDQIYDLDEMSKFGEEKVNRVFDAGRGVKFANNPNPADPFRLTASTPTGPKIYPFDEATMGEAFGDMRRALFGGKADQTIPDLSIALQPRNQEGILNAYKKIPTPTNLLMKMFGGEEEEEQLNELQMQRQGYANDPYSVPVGPALPLDYLQGGFNRLDQTPEGNVTIEEDVNYPVTRTAQDFEDLYPFIFDQNSDLNSEEMEIMTDYLSKRGVLPFAYGGSVAPQSGPMSNGIGTLYNTR